MMALDEMDSSEVFLEVTPVTVKTVWNGFPSTTPALENVVAWALVRWGEAKEIGVKTPGRFEEQSGRKIMC